MPRSFSGLAAALVGTCAFLSGCGYIGPPQYPALNIPVAVIDLGAVERADRLDVSFTIPPLTTEGLAVKSIGGVDLRVGPSRRTPFRVELWAETAKQIEVPAPEKPGLVTAHVPLGDFVGEDVLVAVRVSNAKGRFSDWSNLFTVHVTQPLAKPSGLSASNVAEGVRLQWTAAGAPGFRIFRQSEKEAQPSQLGTSEKPEYLDTTSVYGTSYQYWVQSANDKTESEAAGPVSIKPVDVFPPAAPSGITATQGITTIELSWARNTEPDFKSYRIFRAIGNGNFEQIAADVEAPNFTDKQVESGKRYRYAVAALDQAGNESARSVVVEAAAP